MTGHQAQGRVLVDEERCCDGSSQLASRIRVQLESIRSHTLWSQHYRRRTPAHIELHVDPVGHGCQGARGDFNINPSPRLSFASYYNILSDNALCSDADVPVAAIVEVHRSERQRIMLETLSRPISTSSGSITSSPTGRQH